MIFRSASASDKDAIMELYNSVRGRGFCVWDDEYPGTFEINNDIAHDSLYVLEDDGRIIGGVSVESENELDGLDFWKYNGAPEIARVVIASDRHGEGLAKLLVNGIEKALAEKGSPAVHLLVAKSNTPAYRTYMSDGFEIRGEANMFGHNYFACEKEL